MPKGFQPGHTKSGGRTKGTPDKKRSAVNAAMVDLEYDPKKTLIKLNEKWEALQELAPADWKFFKECSVEMREIAKILMPYMHSRKPVEDIVHNIVTEEPDIHRARTAVLKALRGLQPKEEDDEPND